MAEETKDRVFRILIIEDDPDDVFLFESTGVRLSAEGGVDRLFVAKG